MRLPCQGSNSSSQGYALRFCCGAVYRGRRGGDGVPCTPEKYGEWLEPLSICQTPSNPVLDHLRRELQNGTLDTVVPRASELATDLSLAANLTQAPNGADVAAGLWVAARLAVSISQNGSQAAAPMLVDRLRAAASLLFSTAKDLRPGVLRAYLSFWEGKTASTIDTLRVSRLVADNLVNYAGAIVAAARDALRATPLTSDTVQQIETGPFNATLVAAKNASRQMPVQSDQGTATVTLPAEVRACRSLH